jgi:hypothetical protein
MPGSAEPTPKDLSRGDIALSEIAADLNMLFSR